MILNKTNVPTITLCFIIFIDTRRNVRPGIGVCVARVKRPLDERINYVMCSRLDR